MLPDAACYSNSRRSYAAGHFGFAGLVTPLAPGGGESPVEPIAQGGNNA